MVNLIIVNVVDIWFYSLGLIDDSLNISKGYFNMFKIWEECMNIQ